ncbi:hypothetical protein PI124_g8378 [Phytophthora idaei]|nr:hypothetical protein PI125_g8664 [Phytophthora idaei]KAG3159289.1 hypothetical protein PI126_g7464 [Phytophthora idaei]KAG3246904.1 hypothetical protein PI124_g8378 [Phytophthora idaei]
MYYIPLGREMCLWMDGVDASRSTGERCFKRNTALSSTLAYGPQLEGDSTRVEKASRVHQARNMLGPYVRLRRKWLYNMWTPSKSVTDFFRKTFGIPVLIFWGKFWWMPKAPAEGKRYGLVYGKPIITKHEPTPTDEEVRAVHAEFVSEIEDLQAVQIGVRLRG